jgi:HSP20 family protein
MAGRAVERRPSFSVWWPDLFPSRLADWFELPTTTAARDTEHMLKVEERKEGDDLVIRAEMPGIDPEKDVQIQLQDHTLEIHAERRQEEKHEEEGSVRSEFRYGSFSRLLTMPTNAKESDVQATYKDGILEIRVPLEPTPAVTSKAIPVERK